MPRKAFCGAGCRPVRTAAFAARTPKPYARPMRPFPVNGTSSPACPCHPEKLP